MMPSSHTDANMNLWLQIPLRRKIQSTLPTLPLFRGLYHSSSTILDIQSKLYIPRLQPFPPMSSCILCQKMAHTLTLLHILKDKLALAFHTLPECSTTFWKWAYSLTYQFREEFLGSAITYMLVWVSLQCVLWIHCVPPWCNLFVASQNMTM